MTMRETLRRYELKLPLWLIPMLYVGVTLVYGLVLPRLEHEYLASYSHTMSVASTQAVLSAIASGMMALTGIVFALAFVMVQFSALAYSPRLVAWFGRDPVLFHALGLFTATFFYAIATLAWIDRGGNGKVPLFSTLLVIALLILSMRMNSAEDVLKPGATLTTTRLRAPRAAAIAGILFALLLITSFLLLRLAVPADPLEAGAWLKTNVNTVALALNLVPFAGIAFLWFIGVLRDRLGEREDRFFATVFLGSGLLFLAMLFFSAAMVGGIIIAYKVQSDRLLASATFTFARAITYEIMNIYAIKMAGVFMIATSTLGLRTGFITRWITFCGYAVALLLLFSSRYIEGILLVFPLWVLLISIHILIDNFHGLEE